MAFDFNDLQGQRFQQDLQTASGYKPLIKKDLEAAYGRYKDVGVKVGRVKGKNDSELYKQATDDVLKWWKHNKAEAAKKAAAEAAAKKAAAESAAKSKATPARVAAAPTYGGGSSGGGGGTMLPNTAMGSGGTAARLPTLQTRADPNYVRLEMARAGFRGIIPPSYALTTVQAFDAWLAQQIQLRQGVQKPGTSDPKITATAPKPAAPTATGGGGARAT